METLVLFEVIDHLGSLPQNRSSGEIHREPLVPSSPRTLDQSAPLIGPMPGDVMKEYPGKLTMFLFLNCLVAASGGLILGYDMGVSGGVASMDFFLKEFFPRELEEKMAEETDHYCKLENHDLTSFTSSLYIAAMGSAFFASPMTRMLGRKWSMFCGGLSFMAGPILTGVAVNYTMLLMGRGLLGIGIGFAIQSGPVYMAEIAPAKLRGRLTVIFQIMIGIGILLANLINYFTAKIKGGWGWRLSLAFASIPGAIITIGSYVLPDTPSSLIERGHKGKAKTMLQRTRGIIDVQAEFDDLVVACEKAKTVKHPWSALTKRRYRPHVTFAILIPFFQQMTGINMITFYAPIILKVIGVSNDATLMSAVLIGFVNVFATVVSIAFVDNLGRRFLFLQGGWQMFICQFILGTLIGLMFGAKGDAEVISKSYAVFLVTFLCMFVAAFAWSWGPLGWLVPSEIYPLEIRSVCQSITVAVNMLFTFLFARSSFALLCRMKFVLFYFFAVWTAIMTLFMTLFLPETKNVPIEEMGHVWERHWFWGRFYSDEDDDIDP